MRISVFVAGTALAMMGGSGALAQPGIGSSVGSGLGATGDVTTHTPMIPGTLIPDTTADAAHMTSGTRVHVDAAGQADATTGKKSKHRKHKGSADTSVNASGATGTTTGTGTNTTGTKATTTTATEAGVTASTGSTTMSTSGSANTETNIAPGGR